MDDGYAVAQSAVSEHRAPIFESPGRRRAPAGRVESQENKGTQNTQTTSTHTQTGGPGERRPRDPQRRARDLQTRAWTTVEETVKNRYLKEKRRHSLATLAPCPRSPLLLPVQSGSHTVLLRTRAILATTSASPIQCASRSFHFDCSSHFLRILFREHANNHNTYTEPGAPGEWRPREETGK